MNNKHSVVCCSTDLGLSRKHRTQEKDCGARQSENPYLSKSFRFINTGVRTDRDTCPSVGTFFSLFGFFGPQTNENIKALVP